jgi:hypothetical protein
MSIEKCNPPVRRVKETIGVDWEKLSGPRGPFFIASPGDNIEVVKASFDERSNQVLITFLFDFVGWDAVHASSIPMKSRTAFVCTTVASSYIGRPLLLHDDKIVYQLELPNV